MKKIQIFSLLLFIISMEACSKCYNCVSPSGKFLLTKGTDSVTETLSEGYLIYVLDSFRTKGFKCDTLSFVHQNDGQTCSQKTKSLLESNGSVCVLLK